jgi:methyl-accepting chemotaxis protein
MNLMRKRAKGIEMNGEIGEIESAIQQLVNGNLDITMQMEQFDLLGNLAIDIQQISTAFNGYINEISRVLSHLSAGNMAVSFSKDTHYQGDFVPIKNALHKIKHSLNKSFEEINDLTHEVDRLCDQVENGSNQITQNAIDQAELINNLSGTIYEITRQTTINTQNVRKAAEDVNTIQTEAKVGREYIEQMVDSIKKVQSSSQDISSIISIIDEMANQSKLLALNASIEAARAGEAGRGFSIVANEVGVLAQKSADAVKQTTELINHSILRAKESSKIAEKTSESFKSIQGSIETVATLCVEVAEASEEQTNRLKHTSDIITDISGVVQNNAAYAEENCAGVTELSELTSKLRAIMSRYRLAKQGDTAVKAGNNSQLDPNVQERLFSLLKNAFTTKEVDTVLENIIKDQKDFECLYVIDASGKQLSHTIMNPEIIAVQDENFKPAMPGDYHGEKKYYRQAIKNSKEWYVSVDYISTATGGLCKTLSYAYEAQDNKTYVICVDLICKY